MGTDRRSQRQPAAPLPAVDPELGTDAPRPPSWIDGVARTTRLVATQGTPWTELGGALLAGLGESLGASRVTLFDFPHAGRSIARQRFEWCAGGCRSRAELGAAPELDLEALGLGAWHASLAAGRNVRFDAARQAQASSAGLIVGSLRAVALSPVLAGTRLWGALLVEALDNVPAPGPDPASAVSIVGDALAISLLREERERELRHELERGVVHDLCNLLQIASGAFELLGDDLRAAHPAGNTKTHLVTALEQSLQQGNALARRLLERSATPAARAPEVDLAAHLREHASLWRQAVGPRVRLSIESDSGDARIRLDPTALDQVLLNLIVNARDAMPDGGTLELAVRVRDAADRAPVQRVVLRVRDNGAGIDPSLRERIFEPRFSTKPAGRGSGLGLTTVATLVQRAGGTIEVLGARGGGTEFVLDFPACSGAS
jgi:signal transduction histidine kinase